MPFNGSGTYSLPAGNPVVTGTTISSATHNTTNSDIATALSTVIAKDGQTTPTANLPMGGFKHTGAIAGSASTDYATVGQLTSSTGTYVGTVGGTADVITLTPSPAITAYAAGQVFSFIASGANTTNVTVNVSAVGAKALTKFGTTALVANNILSGSLITIRYDGTQFQLLNVSILPDASTFAGANTFTPTQFFTAGIGPNYLQNIGLLAVVTAKALSVYIRSGAGTDPTATDYAQITFRGAALTTGTTTTRNATTATLVTAPSGATLGFTASQTGYVYIYALDNAGTVETIITGSNHWDEATVQSTTAISATADSGSVLYSTTARTNVPIRYIGRIKIQTGAVAGEWDNEDTEVHVGGVSDKDTDEMTAAQRVQTFSASGTWTKPSAAATTDRVIIQAWGGGGGGGGGSSGTAAGGGGGGGGDYAERIVTISELGSTETVTIPAASAGGTQGVAGTQGGNVTFGSWLTAFGGAPGQQGSGGIGGTGGGAGGEFSAGSGTVGGGLGGGTGGAAEVAGTRATTIWGGGGGGGGHSNTAPGAGGAAYKGGGGGGGGQGTSNGGASSHSGAGGSGVPNGNGLAGSAPSGGGGGGATNTAFTGGNGAIGKVIVTIIG